MTQTADIQTQDLDALAFQLANGLTLEQLRELQGGPRKPRVIPTTTPEQKQATIDYWDKVFATKPSSGGLFVSRSTRQEMPFPEAKSKVWKLMLKRAAQLEALQEKPFEWIIDRADGEVLRCLIKFFVNDPTCELAGKPVSLTKGLFIFGKTGTGKSELLEIMRQLARQEGLRKVFECTNLSQVYSRAKTDKEYDPLTPQISLDRAFDEFGRYVGPVMRFGDSLDVNEAIVEQRYERFKRYGQLSYFVSNMTPNEATERFSPMIFDRLRHMCTSIHFPGESKR